MKGKWNTQGNVILHKRVYSSQKKTELVFNFTKPAYYWLLTQFLVFKVFKLIAAYTSHSITCWCNIDCSGDWRQNSFLPIIPSVCPLIIGQVVRAGLSISAESCAGLWFDSNGVGEFHNSRLTSEMESLSNVNVSSPTWLMNWRRSIDELRISRNC